MSSRWSALAATALLATCVPAFAADTASGSVTVQKLGPISPKFAAAYLVRDQRNARNTQVEILLADVAINAKRFRRRSTRT